MTKYTRYHVCVCVCVCTILCKAASYRDEISGLCRACKYIRDPRVVWRNARNCPVYMYPRNMRNKSWITYLRVTTVYFLCDGPWPDILMQKFRLSPSGVPGLDRHELRERRWQAVQKEQRDILGVLHLVLAWSASVRPNLARRIVHVM